MPGNDNLDIHLGGALRDRFEIVNLEPQQHAVSIRSVIAIANPPVMVFYSEAMQLKNKLAIRYQLFICRAPMIAPAPKQSLIPPAACFHIGNSNQRLRTHLSSLSPSDCRQRTRAKAPGLPHSHPNDASQK